MYHNFQVILPKFCIDFFINIIIIIIIIIIILRFFINSNKFFSLFNFS